MLSQWIQSSDAEIDEEILEFLNFLSKLWQHSECKVSQVSPFFSPLQLKGLFNSKLSLPLKIPVNIPILSSLKTAENCALQNTVFSGITLTVFGMCHCPTLSDNSAEEVDPIFCIIHESILDKSLKKFLAAIYSYLKGQNRKTRSTDDGSIWSLLQSDEWLYQRQLGGRAITGIQLCLSLNKWNLCSFSFYTPVCRLKPDTI